MKRYPAEAYILNKEVQPMQPQNRSNSGAAMGAMFIFLALVFIIGPIVAASFVPALGGVTMIILVAFGVFMLLIGTIITVITRLYVRVPADRAFVRTGRGGPQAVIDGGALVIPVIHEIVWVTLQTMRIEVVRQSLEALLTKDYLRADIKAEFFIKVPKDDKAVKNAATSMGIGAMNQAAVRELIEKKLESALRQVAAEMEITELLQNRTQFIERVSTHVSSDIESNGLLLESVTISQLDQTPRTAMRDEENVFDAQGAKKIATIVTEQKVARRQIELAGDQQVRAQEVKTNQFLYEQEIAQAQAAASKDQQIRIAQATAAQQSATAAAEQDQLARVAEVNRDKAVALAQVQRDQALALANQTREREVQEALIATQQAVETANRARDIAIAEQDRLKAVALAAQLAAEAERADKQQQVETVNVTAEAERRKRTAIIQAQASAEQQQLAKQMEATVAAYAVLKQAEAEQQAAALRAQALIQQAEADQKAKVLQAQGEQAMQIVPVEVDRERVAVEQQRVAVQRSSLESQAQFESIARELQVQLAQIEAQKVAATAWATAYGEAMAKANVTIWGDTNTLNAISSAFTRGQTVGNFLDGMNGSTPQAVKDMLGPVLASLVANAPKILGKEISSEQARELLGAAALTVAGEA